MILTQRTAAKKREKRSLHEVNEHFEPFFNAANKKIANAMVFILGASLKIGFFRTGEAALHGRPQCTRGT